jgi:hypothetical protein
MQKNTEESWKKMKKGERKKKNANMQKEKRKSEKKRGMHYGLLL